LAQLARDHVGQFAIPRVAGRSQTSHFEIEALVGTEGHRQVRAEAPRAVRLKRQLEAPISQDQVGAEQLGAHILAVLIIVRGRQLLAHLVLVRRDERPEARAVLEPVAKLGLESWSASPRDVVNKLIGLL